MANKTIIMTKLRQILKFYLQGKSKLQISQHTGTSRNTVKRYIRKLEELQLSLEAVLSMTDHELEQQFAQTEAASKDKRFEELQQLLPDIERQLKRKGNTILSVWQKYKTSYPQGYEITQFYLYYREYCKRANTTMHIHHKAGDKMYIDFAGDKLSIVDQATGEVTKVEVFAAILGCSQLLYVEAVNSQRKEDLIKATENAMHYFGGVPQAIVPDNLRAAVTKSSRYEPIINETFADFAEHYNTVVLPTRAYRPKDKALVEGAVKIIYRRIYSPLQDKQFYSLEELNNAIKGALEAHNAAPFKGRDFSRRQRFEEIEKQELKPLPHYLYELKQQAMATVMKNGHVCLGIDKHYYSVPYQFIGRKIKLLYTATTIEVFYHYECIAKHQRSAKRYHYSTTVGHLASAHQFLTDWTPAKFITQAQSIHADVALYIEGVFEHKSYPEQAYKSCSGILQLHRRVGAERLINACRRAQSFGIFNYPIILQILEKNLDTLTDEEQRLQQESLEMPSHSNIRGSAYYH
ncbi:IS21 family transposase [Flavobacterium sp.]|uniref:IS21 family transposase n=1 Tax=Flavobacterium sp. TaxID=239 RepID=UPI0038D1F3C2